MYFRFILAYTTNGTGGPMSVYVSICMYICRKYMHIHQSVYVRISSSIFVCISNSISVRIFVCISSSISCTRSRCRHGCFAFAGAGARSLHLRRAVATASLSRGSARHIAKFNQIWSARQNSGSQRQLVEARAEVSLRAELPWQSWLAVVHEVTAEQRRPSDVEKMRSLSNRQSLLRKRSRIFWNQLHTEIQAQKNQRSRLQSY